MAQAITRTTICIKMLPSCGAALRHAFVTKPRIVKRMHSKHVGVGLALLAVLVASIDVLHTNSAPLSRPQVRRMPMVLLQAAAASMCSMG